MDNQKIFFLANSASIHTVKWVDYFIEKNYEVHLATFVALNKTQCKNVYFLSAKKMHSRGGNYHYLLSIFKLVKILKEIQPNYINAHYSYSMGLIALLAKQYAKIESEFSIVCHGSDVLSPPNEFIFNTLNRYVLKRADKVFCVSDQIKDKIEGWGIESDKVYIGQYGIDIKDKDVDKDIDIISNRAYVPNSRIDFLLNTLKVFEQENLNIVFVLPSIDETSYQNLVKLYPFVNFLKKVEYEEMMNLVNRSKIYISATQSDGTSLSLLEAMYLRCVPIVSNIVSNRSWILDGINGFLFNNKNDFVLKIKEVLSTSNTRMIDLNRQIIKNKGNYLQQMNKIEKFMIG
jgi:glycosyltransferase involved in cell wall biosynthesis